MPEERTSRKGDTYFIVTTAELEGAHGWKYTHAGRRGRGACVMHGGDNPTAMDADFKSGWVQCRTRGCVGRIAEHPDTHAGRDAATITIGGHRLGRSKATPAASPPPPKPKPAADPIAAANLHAELAGYRERLPGSPGAAYLEGRGFAVDLATAYGIGWGGSTGRMANRVVFPLADPSGLVTSATGRGIAADADPKYYTLPSSTYRKTLVNGGALQVAARERLPVYVCEGPMDALALIAGGITTAVAMLGTSGFRVEWLADVPLVVACFDDDAAGRKGRDELTFAAGSLGVPVQVMPTEILQGMNDLADFWKARLALPPELVAHWDAAQLATDVATPEPGPDPADDFAFTDNTIITGVTGDFFTDATRRPEPTPATVGPRDADATPTQPVGGLPADVLDMDTDDAGFWGEPAGDRHLIAGDWEDADDGPALLAELEDLRRDADPDVPPDGIEPADWAAIASPLARRRLKARGVELTSRRAVELCPDGAGLWVAACVVTVEGWSASSYAHLVEDLRAAYAGKPSFAFWQAVMAEAGARRRANLPNLPRCFTCGTELVAGMSCRTCHPWVRPLAVVGVELDELRDDLQHYFGNGGDTWFAE